MTGSLIFLFLATGWVITAFYAIDLQTEKKKLEYALTVAKHHMEHLRKVAAAAVFEAHALGDEDRSGPLDDNVGQCYQLHADVYGDKPNG